MWQAMFGVANVWALAMWAVLVLLPRRPFPLALVLYGGVGLLCMAYSIAIVAVMSGSAGGGGAAAIDFTTMEGVRSIFASDAGVAIGWTHYLALDLFTGLWIARDADDKGFARWVQAPVLVLTFLAGPLGLFLWLVVRERRARKRGRPE